MPATAALHYARDAYTAAPGVIFGRLRVSADFFSAYAQHAGADTLHCVAPTREDAADLGTRLTSAGVRKPLVWIPEARFESVSRCGALMIYSPKLTAYATARHARRQDRAFSLVGVTHSLSGAVAARWMLDYVTAPIHPWDALICTSRAAQTMVRETIEAHRAYLAHRLGTVAPPHETLQLPVIPLGIDVSRFAETVESASARAQWRERLGIAADAVVALYLGRMSTRNKTNPFAMLRAAEIAAAQAPLTLIMAGLFDDEEAARGWREAARLVSPSVACHFVDGRTLDSEPPLWPAADFFLSLIDNIQETFGLSPVEAMAAGLPVIASDWDGYRDTVEHGVTGFRAPTLMPGRPHGADLAIAAFEGGAPEDTHIPFVASVAQSTVIDIGAAAAAIACLAVDGERRAVMGRAARERAKTLYDWPVVIAAYEALFAQLADLRDSHARVETPGVPGLPPLYVDPFVQYRAFATRTLMPSDRLEVIAGPVAGFPGDLLIAQGGAEFRLSAEATAGLMARIAASPGVSVAEIVDAHPADERSVAMRTLAWLIKFDCVRVRGLGQTPIM
ncbi:MAG: glycosyltransferase family 4 protein [Labrys sp. (in: a-proteobacteria)]|jgi:starch synthase